MSLLTNPQLLRLVALELRDLHGDAPLAEGQHAVDARFRLRVQGSVEQAPNQLVTPTAKIPMLPVLALVAERGGIKRERFEALLVEAMTEALQAGEPASAYLECSKEAERRVRAKVLEELPKMERAGPLRRVLTVTATAEKARTKAG